MQGTGQIIVLKMKEGYKQPPLYGPGKTNFPLGHAVGKQPYSSVVQNQKPCLHSLDHSFCNSSQEQLAQDLRGSLWGWIYQIIGVQVAFRSPLHPFTTTSTNLSSSGLQRQRREPFRYPSQRFSRVPVALDKREMCGSSTSLLGIMSCFQILLLFI